MFLYPEVYDDRVDGFLMQQVGLFLDRPGWGFGWKSDAKKDPFSFFHKHFGGAISPDHYGGEQRECVKEIPPVLRELWDVIAGLIPGGQTLLRCYANGMPFGCDGTLHTDSVDQNAWTWIYYPASIWKPDWGGETMFYQASMLMCAVEPRPGRLICFSGTVPHLARGVTRQCPLMRITLMFKVLRKSSSGTSSTPIA